jgi:hypothetical protein
MWCALRILVIVLILYYKNITYIFCLNSCASTTNECTRLLGTFKTYFVLSFYHRRKTEQNGEIHKYRVTVIRECIFTAPHIKGIIYIMYNIIYIHKILLSNSEMCHHRCVYKLIGRGTKSITQQVHLMMFIRGWYNYMFRPIPAIIRFSSERVLVFTRSMRMCNDGEISSSVVLIIATIRTHKYK